VLDFSMRILVRFVGEVYPQAGRCVSWYGKWKKVDAGERRENANVQRWYRVMSRRHLHPAYITHNYH
jgi:hypothetical protein